MKGFAPVFVLPIAMITILSLLGVVAAAIALYVALRSTYNSRFWA
jgi:site-specific recombinase